MIKKEYSHLIKPMVARSGPQGLYPEPRVFMEGRDLEGFEANFSLVMLKNLKCCIRWRDL